MPDPHPAPRRDHLIDLLRIASAGVVVTMHWLSTRVWVDGDGMHSTLALEGRTIFVLGWLLQVMPVLFIAGGFANTKVVDSCRAKGQSATDYLGIRARRLTTPLVLLAAVIVPVTVTQEEPRFHPRRPQVRQDRQVAGSQVSTRSRPREWHRRSLRPGVVSCSGEAPRDRRGAFLRR